jgi:pilus assembly protein CpaB
LDKGRIIRLVLIPVVIALVVTLIVRQQLTQAEPTASPQVEMVSVVVLGSKEPLAARVKVAESQLAVKQVPKTILTGNEFTTIKDVAGQIAIVTIAPGEMLLKSRFVPEGQGSLPYRIPQGARAISIRIDELSGVAGHPQPGDLVDLVLFLPAKAPDRPGATTRILYEAILVLGKGLASPVGTGQENAKLTSLTLALEPAAAVEVTLAEQIGHIKILLRPALKESHTGGIQMHENRYK